MFSYTVQNVYVQITNVNGSTVAPPVVVQASVLSDLGSRSLLPDRLKQLAQVITGSHAANLGLNHSVFGKVNKVVLSSYMEHSIGSPSTSPSPSPAPSKGSPNAASSPLYPTFPCAPTTSADHPRPPCLHCDAFTPSKSPLSYAPEPGPKPPSPSSSPGPSVQDHAPPPRYSPFFSSLLPPSSSIFLSHMPPTNYAPIPVPVQYKPLAPTSQMPEIHGPSPVQNEGSSKNPTPPISALSDIPPSSVCKLFSPLITYLFALLKRSLSIKYSTIFHTLL